MLHGQVREVDRLGNNAADEAADFGRRRVSNAVIDARRNLSGVCNRWYLVLLDLHRFFIAISRAVVNHGGRDGTAPDPLVWMRFVTRPFCLGRLVFGIRNGFIFLHLPSALRTLLFGPKLLVLAVLQCSVSFWVCSLLVLCIWELTIWEWFVILDGHHGPVPLELVNDGDLLLLIERMLHLRVLDTVRISKVKGHADEGTVLDGRVREVDRLGNDAADEAADFGRRRVSPAVLDARRN